jgi:hypothetical protein
MFSWKPRRLDRGRHVMGPAPVRGCSGYAEPATCGANPGISVVSVTIECQTPSDTKRPQMAAICRLDPRKLPSICLW